MLIWGYEPIWLRLVKFKNFKNGIHKMKATYFYKRLKIKHLCIYKKISIEKILIFKKSD